MPQPPGFTPLPTTNLPRDPNQPANFNRAGYHALSNQYAGTGQQISPSQWLGFNGDLGTYGGLYSNPYYNVDGTLTTSGQGAGGNPRPS